MKARRLAAVLAALGFMLMAAAVRAVAAPAFLAAGESAHLDAPSPEARASARLVSRRTGLAFPAGLAAEAGRLKVTVPAGTPPDFFDLEIAPPAGAPRRLPRAVKVLRDAASLRVLHLTDIHWGEEGAKKELLARALEAARLLDPDLVLSGGDMMTEPREEGFAEIRRLLDGLPFPVFYAAGNHDHRDLDLFRRHFSERTWYSFDAGRFHIVVLDTGGANGLLSHEGEGLGPEQMRWLAGDLAGAAGRSVWIVAHHSPLVESHSFEAGRREFLDLVRRRGVKGILAGHVHRDQVVDLDGRSMAFFKKGAVPVIHTTTLSSGRLRGDHRGFRFLLLAPERVSRQAPFESLVPGDVLLECPPAGASRGECRLVNRTHWLLPGVRVDLEGVGAAWPGPGRVLWRGDGAVSVVLDLERGSVALPGRALEPRAAGERVRRAVPAGVRP